MAFFSFSPLYRRIGLGSRETTCAALLFAVLILGADLPAFAQQSLLPGDMKAHLARHKELQSAIAEARETLEMRKAAAPSEAGVTNYFLTQLDLLESLAQNAFDLSFIFYDRILASEKAGNILAGYIGQRLTLLADSLFDGSRSFRTHLAAVPALNNLPGLTELMPALEQFIDATSAHAEDILSSAG